MIERIGDPVLAARLMVMGLPAAAARIPGTLAYDLTIKDIGSWRVSVADGRARVDEISDSDGRSDFRLITDAESFVSLANGASPLGLMLRRRLKIKGKRRRARLLRHMNGDEPTMADVVAAGGSIDPGLMLEAITHLVDPDWTKGHSFTVAYEIEGAGRWAIGVNDGQPLQLLDEASPDTTVKVSLDTYTRLATRELSPDQAMQGQLTKVDGQLYPLTLLGRWIDRSQGEDDAELEREAAQREIQERRSAVRVPGEGELLDYRQLYRVWEHQQWQSTDIDFSRDKEHWLATPAAAQESTIWSMGSFYVAEERVTADLAPFLGAAPSGEIELFLATQLVDEARHAAFFDRFGAEVMALGAEDLRGRMEEVSERLMSAWSVVFDDGLRAISRRIAARPDDIDLFVEGITTYHLVLEGLLATTGQKFIRDYLLAHDLYPGFCEGFGLVERDEHRHIAFGMRFLKDAIEDDPRHGRTVERTVLELAPKACYVFVPPYAKDAREFTSYGYHSSEIYGYAYRTLKRRMGVLGLQVPPAEELMPGPVAEADALPAAPPDQPAGFSQNGEGRQANGQQRDAEPREQKSFEPGIG